MTQATFPPLTPDDIDAYPIEDCVAGYLGHEKGEDMPGPNHAPGYRWGWLNRQRDRSNGTPDGHDAVRRAYIDRFVIPTPTASREVTAP
jgi:hypothetical protein